MKIADLQKLAYQVAALPTLRKQTIPEDAALYRFWRSHPEVGPLAMHEVDIDEGGRAVITLTGRVLWWHSGDDVEVR